MVENNVYAMHTALPTTLSILHVSPSIFLIQYFLIELVLF